MLPLTPQVFAILSALIEERLGIHYGAGDLTLLQDKVSPRAQDAGFESLLDYYYFLRYDPGGAEELHALADALVVNETYFFRELDQLKVLCRQLVRERLERQGRVRIWSAASSTGEEILTVAMLLAAEGLLDRVDLVASDLSRAALSRARSGRFTGRSLRNVSAAPDLARRYLRDEGGGVHRVTAELLDAVDWRQVNLIDADQVRALGMFDFILCRNVLIYFRDSTAMAVLTNLGSVLKPGGALLVSVSESLIRFGSAFTFEEQGGAFIYRKGAK